MPPSVSEPTAREQPLAALFVASWYPGINDPGLGRFVANQAEALRDSGLVRPLVASFETAYVDSSAAGRADAVMTYLRHALETRADAISPAGWSLPAQIGVARLPVPEPSRVGALPPGAEADHRRAALEALAERLDTAGMTGVVHAHTAYPDGYAALGAAERLGWPLVITEHASFVARQLRQPEYRRRYLEAAEAASRFIAVSDMLASELRTAIPEIGEKLVVVPNVIPLHAFDPASLEQRNRDELLFVGDRKERKGIVVLLRAFADVLEERPGATLRLIGKSSTDGDEARWKEMATDFGISHAVRFEGTTDRAGVAAALRRASVFVHPSPRETFGVVTLEALASGVPVVATESGGISGILADERLGALVPARDSRMLARAILRTLERLAEFDPQALRGAVAPYSGESVAPRLAALYARVIAEADGERAPASSATPTVPWQGRAEPIEHPVIVLAHDTQRAARAIARLPAELQRRVTLVTHGDAAREPLPSDVRRVVFTRDHIAVELQRRGLHGRRGGLRDRVLRLVANPLAPIRRRLVRGGLVELRWEATAAGIHAAIREMPHAPGDGTSPPEVLCVDVPDHAVGARLVADEGFRATPGGLSWLADRWAAAQAVDGPSGDAGSAAVAAARERAEASPSSTF